MEEGISAPQSETLSIPTIPPTAESKERVQKGGFSIRFDKEGLKTERENIAAGGRATLDTFLNFPDVLEFPEGATFVIGDNGSGKSSMLGLLDLVGHVNALYEARNRVDTSKPSNYTPRTWEQVRDRLLESRLGMQTSEWKKYGIAPNILKHVKIETGAENLAVTRMVRVPEVAGQVWNNLAHAENGSYNIDIRNGGRAVFEKGDLDMDEEEGGAPVMGSTQQIIDQMVMGDLRRKVADTNGPQTVLLDEPTANADLKRTMNFMGELQELSAANSAPVTTVVSTNEGLLSIHKGINRIDMSHPERGVHKLGDYALDPDIEAFVNNAGYASINKSSNQPT